MEKMDNLEMKMKVLMQSLHLPREEPLKSKRRNPHERRNTSSTYSPIVLSNEETCAVFDSEGVFQDIYRECQQAVE
ncbi:hypothetical protein E4U11_000796 [Claviceps purpurea]|nr:hypothetical protein E4U11_000796 [Claviceps purpurea]